MVVCICHNVTERHIKAAVENGVRTLPELRAHTGCSGTCGKCASTALTIVREHHQVAATTEVEHSLPAFTPAFAPA